MLQTTTNGIGGSGAGRVGSRGRPSGRAVVFEKEVTFVTANGDQDRPSAAARTNSSTFFPDGFGARACRGEDRWRRPPRRLAGPLGRRGDRRPAGLLVVALLVAAVVLAVIPSGFAQDALEVDSYTVDATITAGGDSCGFDVREEIAVTFLQDTAGFTWLSTHEIANFEASSDQVGSVETDVTVLAGVDSQGSSIQITFPTQAAATNATFVLEYTLDGVMEAVINKNEVTWLPVSEAWLVPVNDITVTITIETVTDLAMISAEPLAAVSVTEEGAQVVFEKPFATREEGFMVTLEFPLVRDCGALPSWVYYAVAGAAGLAVIVLLICVIVQCRKDDDPDVGGSYGMKGASSYDKGGVSDDGDDGVGTVVGADSVVGPSQVVVTEYHATEGTVIAPSNASHSYMESNQGSFAGPIGMMDTFVAGDDHSNFGSVVSEGHAVMSEIGYADAQPQSAQLTFTEDHPLGTPVPDIPMPTPISFETGVLHSVASVDSSAVPQQINTIDYGVDYM